MVSTVQVMMVIRSRRFGERTFRRIRECIVKGSASLIPHVDAGWLIESLRAYAHPGITVRSGPTGHRAALSDGPDVWEVVDALNAIRHDEPTLHEDRVVPTLAAVTGLSTSQVNVALRYYRVHAARIDHRIAANTQLAERAERAWLSDQERPGQES